MKKSLILFAFCLSLCLGYTGCGDASSPAPADSVSQEIISGESVSENAQETSQNTVSEDSGPAQAPAASVTERPEAIEYTISENQIVKFSSYDLTDTYDQSTATLIEMNDMEVTITGTGAQVEDNKVVITSGGTYILEGSLANGQIYVHAGDDEKVQLVFRNIDIFCNTSAPVYIENADKTVITLPEGTINNLSDSLAPLDDSAGGCIYSKDDLTINGTGTLNITANYNNGISCKNDLTIVDGTYNITAANNGLKGNDSISILTCTMNIESLDDGCKVSNDTEENKGYLFIAGGIFNITANDNCFQSTRAFVIQGGHVLGRSYGKIVKCDGYQIGTEEYVEAWM